MSKILNPRKIVEKWVKTQDIVACQWVSKSLNSTVFDLSVIQLNDSFRLYKLLQSVIKKAKVKLSGYSGMKYRKDDT